MREEEREGEKKRENLVPKELTAQLYMDHSFFVLVYLVYGLVFRPIAVSPVWNGA